MVECLNRLKRLVIELGYARHAVSEFEQKRRLLRGLPAEINVTIDLIISVEINFQQAGPRLVVRELRLQRSDIPVNKVLVMCLGKEARICHLCGRQGHIKKNS